MVFIQFLKVIHQTSLCTNTQASIYPISISSLAMVLTGAVSTIVVLQRSLCSWCLSRVFSKCETIPLWTGHLLIIWTDGTHNLTYSHPKATYLILSTVSCVIIEGKTEQKYPGRACLCTGMTCRLHTKSPCRDLNSGLGLHNIANILPSQF